MDDAARSLDPVTPADFLSSVDVWIRIYNIPVNHYNIDTMNFLASKIGQVLEITYDPKVSQKEAFIRAQVRLDISRPALESKVLNLPRGGSVVIKFEYEKLKKRCHNCFRLTHERPDCPLLHNRNRGSSLKNQSPTQRPVQSSQPQSPAKGKELSASPTVPPGFQPLFKELPIEERNAALLYISHSDETERLARIARVQQSINIGPEPSLPKITHDLTKGKGHVFSFEEPQRLNKRQNTFGVATSVQNEFQSKDKLMTRSFPLELEGASSSSLTSPTGFSIGTSFEAQSSGSKSGVKSSRKRPQRWKRLAMRAQRAKEEGTVVAVTEEEKQQGESNPKRKAVLNVGEHSSKSPKPTPSTVASNLKPLPSQ
ncbi:uncharacterized protein LOC108846772 [Raphanus sativus]|uniref:Uncharacterized protein LOC108846772 n=1 Tax=Raphanus sativus TaxID=3726 RepID=A0A6J0MUD3_RAPSA|nr:uncharacterized protein LOC108846772 [Raphanus sativus]